MEGASPSTVNCSIRTVSISTARGGNKPRYAWTYKPWRPGVEALSYGRNDLGGEQTRRPEHQELSAAPKTNACMKSFCRIIRHVPTHLGFGEGRCLVGRNEHVHHEDSRGKGPSIRGKICGENAGKGLVPVGAHSNRRRLCIRAEARRHRGSRSDA